MQIILCTDNFAWGTDNFAYVEIILHIFLHTSTVFKKKGNRYPDNFIRCSFWNHIPSRAYVLNDRQKILKENISNSQSLPVFFVLFCFVFVLFCFFLFF